LNRPRILYLAHRAPTAPDRGDRIRSYHWLTRLAREADVWLATCADEPLTQVEAARLEALCERTAIATVAGRGRWLRGASRLALGGTATEGLFWSADLKQQVDAWSKEVSFDAALVFCSSMGAYLPRSLPAERVVLDLVDVDSEKWHNYAARARGPARWLFDLEGRRLRSLEQKLAARSHAVALVSEAEAQLFRGIAPSTPVFGVPNGVDLDYFHATQSDEAEGRTCVFVGALDYRANIDAVTWFCHEAWPEVRRRQPQATLLLVGRKPTVAVRQLDSIAGVRVVGQVPDVRPYLEQATVAVAPLRIARGIQNKVLEAAAMSRAVVVSPAALEGLELQPGREVELAEDPREWGERISALMNDAPRRRALAMAARRHVEAKHSWQACFEPLARLLGLRRERVGAKPAPPLGEPATT